MRTGAKFGADTLLQRVAHQLLLDSIVAVGHTGISSPLQSAEVTSNS